MIAVILAEFLRCAGRSAVRGENLVAKPRRTHPDHPEYLGKEDAVRPLLQRCQR